MSNSPILFTQSCSPKGESGKMDDSSFNNWFCGSQNLSQGPKNANIFKTSTKTRNYDTKSKQFTKIKTEDYDETPDLLQTKRNCDENIFKNIPTKKVKFSQSSVSSNNFPMSLLTNEYFIASQNIPAHPDDKENCLSNTQNEKISALEDEEVNQITKSLKNYHIPNSQQNTQATEEEKLSPVLGRSRKQSFRKQRQSENYSRETKTVNKQEKFSVKETVFVFDKSKLYLAIIRQINPNDKTYLIHYVGYNKHYDEWVKEEQILKKKPTEETQISPKQEIEKKPQSCLLETQYSFIFPLKPQSPVLDEYKDENFIQTQINDCSKTGSPALKGFFLQQCEEQNKNPTETDHDYCQRHQVLPQLQEELNETDNQDENIFKNIPAKKMKFSQGSVSSNNFPMSLLTNEYFIASQNISAHPDDKENCLSNTQNEKISALEDDEVNQITKSLKMYHIPSSQPNTQATEETLSPVLGRSRKQSQPKSDWKKTKIINKQGKFSVKETVFVFEKSKLYSAIIRQINQNDKTYLIHYVGYNKRYDEWVNEEQILKKTKTQETQTSPKQEIKRESQNYEQDSFSFPFDSAITQAVAKKEPQNYSETQDSFIFPFKAQSPVLDEDENFQQCEEEKKIPTDTNYCRNENQVQEKEKEELPQLQEELNETDSQDENIFENIKTYEQVKEDLQHCFVVANELYSDLINNLRKLANEEKGNDGLQSQNYKTLSQISSKFK